MALPRIEYVNIAVSDLARAAELIKDLFGWQIRWEGPARDGGRAIHVGSDETYIALYSPPGVTSDYAFSQGRIPLERDAEKRRATALAERLRLAEPIIVVKTGTQAHRVAEGDVLYVQAADDYCEVVLASGRRLLVTMNLTRFLATMSPQFVRVHKSYGVNGAHVTGSKTRPGGGRNLVLSDQGTVPIGRSYGAAVAAWFARSAEVRQFVEQSDGGCSGAL